MAQIVYKTEAKTYRTLITRTWANAQRDGRPADIGSALCSTPQSLADVHY